MLKSFNNVIEDLLGNYDKYTDEEKAKIKELFKSVSDLNAILDKYDIETEFSWKEYFESVSRYLGAN